MDWWIVPLDARGVGEMVCAFAASAGAIAEWRCNRRLRARLRRRERSLAHSLNLVNMAEELAHFGRWRASPRGRAEWSPGLCRIAGFPAGMTPDFETQCEMMPDGGKAFHGALEAHRRDRAPFAFEFAATRVDGEERILRVVARNEFDEETGRLLERQGVALDVTEERHRAEALKRETNAAYEAAEAARKLAETDPLTQLPNRRRVMAEADRAALAATLDGTAMAMLIFDIDHFKAVNDRHGHPAGDAVLVRVADIAQRTMRAGDLTGRIGGEEFLCILPGADLPVARACAERLRRAIAQGSSVEGMPPVTISAGVAGWRKGDSALSLFARADAALYEAKQAGRDCVRRAA